MGGRAESLPTKYFENCLLPRCPSYEPSSTHLGYSLTKGKGGISESLELLFWGEVQNGIYDHQRNLRRLDARTLHTKK